MFGRKNKHAEDPLLSTPPTADLESLGEQTGSMPLHRSEVGSSQTDFERHFNEAASSFDDFFDGDTNYDADNQIARDLR
jgi:hypothetical protein